MIIDGLAGLFAQFKSDWAPGFLLSHRCAILRLAARSDILDADSDGVTATKFAVNRQIEHSKVARAAFNLEFCSNRTCLGRSGGFAPVNFPLFQGHSLMVLRVFDYLILHGLTPRLQRTRSTCRRLVLGPWNQVRFRATADFASGPAGATGRDWTKADVACLE
jgi:hypothetical protein